MRIAVVQCKSLPMSRSIQIALISTIRAALSFPQFILSHPTAVNRPKLRL